MDLLRISLISAHDNKNVDQGIGMDKEYSKYIFFVEFPNGTSILSPKINQII